MSGEKSEKLLKMKSLLRKFLLVSLIFCLTASTPVIVQKAAESDSTMTVSTTTEESAVTTVTSSTSIDSARSNVNDKSVIVVENEKSLSGDDNNNNNGNEVDEKVVENDTKIVEVEGNDIDSWESELKFLEENIADIDGMEKNSILISKLSTTEAAAGNSKGDETTKSTPTTTMTTESTTTTEELKMTATTTISDKHSKTLKESVNNKNLSQRLVDIETSRDNEKDNETSLKVQEEKNSTLGWETAIDSDDVTTGGGGAAAALNQTKVDNQMKVLRQVQNFMRAYAARSLVVMLTEARRRQLLPSKFLPAQPTHHELHSSSSSIVETFVDVPPTAATSCDECQHDNDDDDEVTQPSRSHDEFEDLTMTPKRQPAKVSFCENSEKRKKYVENFLHNIKKTERF